MKNLGYGLAFALGCYAGVAQHYARRYEIPFARAAFRQEVVADALLLNGVAGTGVGLEAILRNARKRRSRD